MITLEQLHELKMKELPAVCADLRGQLIDVVNRNGGHLASNLGTVELLVALNYVYGKDDRFVFDVGHQSYVHRMIRGGMDFSTLRKEDGFGAFPQIGQGDDYGGGHSSIAISAALGLAEARDKSKQSYDVISVVGDGALTGGIAFEGLNNISGTKMLIVLNDNQMSIGRNVGNLSRGLKKMRVGEKYINFKNKTKRFLLHIPLLGPLLVGIASFLKDAIKSMFVPDTYFENFNVKYIGPVDGHNIRDLITTLRYIKKNTKRPTILHVLTTKGKGLEEAENSPQDFHGVSASSGEDVFSMAAGETLCGLAEKDEKVLAVTAAMADGTGLKQFALTYPDKFYDVGIAEEHAVCFCAGLSAGGFRPHFAVYSTFLQRAFDQVATELSVQGLKCTLLVDRAGFSGNDGATHQGLYDITYLTALPNLSLYAPANALELKEMIRLCQDTTGITAIRYPKGDKEVGYPVGDITKWHAFGDVSDCEVVILAVGPRMLEQAISAAGMLKQKGHAAVAVSARRIKPLDTEFLDKIANSKIKLIVTAEENVLSGGFGSAVNAYIGGRKNLINLGVDDKIVHQASIESQMKKCGLLAEQISEKIIERLQIL